MAAVDDFALLDVPIPVDSLPDTMARTDGSSHLFMSMTVTHPVDGTLNLLWSDSSFTLDGDPSGSRVYPVVFSWGHPRKMLPVNESIRDYDFEVQLDANASFVPSNKVTPYIVYRLFQVINMQGVEVLLYQWSEDSIEQMPVWRGFLTGIIEGSTNEGSAFITVKFSSVGTSILQKVSPIIGKEIYTTSTTPQESRGLMSPIARGKLTTSMGTSGTVNEAMFLGYTSQFVEGVRVAEDNTNAQLTYEFSRADGSKSMAQINSGTTGDPQVDSGWWIQVQGSNSFGMIDAADIAVTNDTTSLRAVINMGLRAWVPVLPADVGSMMHAGLVASAYKVTNLDPTDFMETTSTDYTIAFNVPPLQIPGFRCTKAYVMVDIEGSPIGGSATRTFDFGLWNVSRFGGANYWDSTTFGPGTKGTATINIGTGPTPRQRLFMHSGATLTYYDAGSGANLGGSAAAQFIDGNFIGLDASSNATPIQVVLSTTSASKDKVRVYGMSVILYGTPGLYGTRLVVAGSRPVSQGYGKWQDLALRYRYPNGVPIYKSVADAASPKNSVKVMVTGWMQKDTGTSYEGGAADATIEKGSSIIHHLVRNMNPNVGSSVGNFVDARTEVLTGEKAIRFPLGSTPMNYRETIDVVQKMTNVRYFDKNGISSVVYDDMNPDRSRFYRSGVELVRIMGCDIEQGSFKFSTSPLDEIVNRVRLNFGQGFQSDRPLGTTTYDNAMSQMLYGSREEITEDAPWISMPDITSLITPNPAVYRSRYLGRRNARPRATVVCTVPQKYFDIELGHIVEFGTDMDSYGFRCPLHRCGQVDYVLSNQTQTTNGSNNKTQVIVALTSDSTYLGFSQQIDAISYAIGTPGNYTNVTNAWQYSASEGFISAQQSDLTWNNFANVVNEHGFKSSGIQTTSWDRPDPWAWKKADILFGGAAFQTGPVYWARYQYITGSTQAVLSDIFTYSARWYGRLFEVIEINPKLGGFNDYPKRELVLQEIM